MKNRYRIVTDKFLGFEVQIKRWWLPFWYQCGGENRSSNTHSSVEDAMKFIEKHKTNSTRKKRQVIFEEEK